MKRLLIWITCFVLAGCQAKAPESFLIQNARIMDGSGDPAFTGAVRIDGDRIVGVGNLKPLKGEKTLDAAGMLLAPGFIDSHSHHDRQMENHRDMLGAVSQGITTIVRGADGDSGLEQEYAFISQADFTEKFNAAPTAVNIASFSAHGSIRYTVMGDDFRRLATDDEIGRMSALVEDDMNHGGMGLATGLEYMPGIFSDTEEVIALAKVASRYGGRYQSHVRDEDDLFQDAIDEVIRIGREAKIPVHISHIKLGDKEFWGTTDDVINKLDSARAEGIDISADIYSYLYWSSSLSVLFPAKDYTDRDVAVFTFERTTSPDTLIITRFEPNPAYDGLSIAEIARLNEQDVESTLLDLAQQSDDWLKKTGTGGDSILAKGMQEPDVNRLMAWTYTNICTDGSNDGAHPRGYGSFPRFFSRYAGETTGISKENAIAKMSSLAARNMGIANRGSIKEGNYADLVLLDPETFTDRSTFEEPHLISSGVLSVWVNGDVVFRDGAATGAFPGRIVTRAASTGG